MGSRTEDVLTVIANGETTEINPRCRKEQFLKAIANGDGAANLPEPKCREEQLLMQIAERGIGGGGTTIVTEDITITPTTSDQVKTRSSGKYINKVTVKAIPSEYIIPSGSININVNGTHNVKSAATVNVNVPSSGITPTGTLEVKENGKHDVTNYADIDVKVPIPDGYIVPEGNLEVTENDTYDVTTKKTVTVNVASSGGGGSTPHPELPYSKYINPTWWDIKTILDEDTEDYTNKVIMLLNDCSISTKIYLYAGEYCRTSDGSFYEGTGAYITHTWDVTKDKQCIEDGVELYKTRYIIKYSSSGVPSVSPKNDVLYFEYVGSTSISNSIGSFNSLRILPEPIINKSKDTFKGSSENNIAYSAPQIEYMGEIDLSKSPALQYLGTGTTLNYAPRLTHYKFKGQMSYGQQWKYVFNNNPYVETITGLDFTSVNNMQYSFTKLFSLKNLRIYNLGLSLQIGSGDTWGHKLTVDSLIHTIKELIDTGSSKTLTIGSANTTKLANTYVKLIEDDGSGKLPFELCESTDDGAMLISDYVQLKNWALA